MINHWCVNCERAFKKAWKKKSLRKMLQDKYPEIFNNQKGGANVSGSEQSQAGVSRKKQKGIKVGTRSIGSYDFFNDR